MAHEPKGGKKKLVMIIAIVSAAVILGVGGYVGYTMFSGKAKAAGKDGHGDGKAAKSTLITVDPFVVNLSDPGRYLKVTMQFETDDPANQTLVTERIPKLRDSIITLLSSKSAESISGPEGKFQLKDELLLRTNQAMGKDIFKNLYFTEFVMQ